MAGIYKTPGVYVEEIPKFPPSIAPVETAIPAFIGYTEKAEKDGLDLTIKPTPVKVRSLPEFEVYFGTGPNPTTIEVDLDANNQVKSVKIAPANYLYDSVRMFYANGGGPCYIVSVGLYTAPISKTTLLKGLDAIRKYDEPTLIVIPEAVNLPTNAECGDVHQQMLKQCGELMDRFAILDVKNGDKEINSTQAPIELFRQHVGASNVKYGGAYYPWLRTTLPLSFNYGNISSIKKGASTVKIADLTIDKSVITQVDNIRDDVKMIENFIKTKDYATGYASIVGTGADDNAIAKDELKKKSAFINNVLKEFLALTPIKYEDLSNSIAAKTTKDIFKDYADKGATPNFSRFENIIRALKAYDAAYPTLGGFTSADFTAYDLSFVPSDPNLGLAAVTANVYKNATTDLDKVTNARPVFQNLFDQSMRLISDFQQDVTKRFNALEEELIATNPVYANIYRAIKNNGVVLPPSGAIAGLYAQVDNLRGVWKAPANVSVNAVVEPTVIVSDEDQKDLNVDVNAGKSINIIRSFTGKGTLVWGARTLAGNDNEWRYVPVRRFFNFVEESVKKATEQFVFEPNDANTWVRIQGMIENFLTTLWRQGALQGIKPEHAFYVAVGLGKTMTPVDILEGRMIIEIGMAAVRPAEFIILKFSHKMAES